MSTVITAARIQPIAKAGLIAKGIVYVILGALVFMAAFNIGNQSANTSKEDVLSIIKEQTGGQIILAALALGLLCYSGWRFLQTFGDTEHKGSDGKGIAVRARYFFSGFIYLSLALLAIKILFGGNQGKKGNQGLVHELLNKPFGNWVLGIVAVIIFCTGVYQCYYGFSEKYRKHVDKAGHNINNKLLFIAGKTGYVARGIVWLIIGWMFMQAALHSNSSEAGDTPKAFSFLEHAAYGSYLLGAVGLGLVCYGIFNFIRARHEQIGA